MATKKVIVKKKGRATKKKAPVGHWFFSHNGETLGPLTDVQMCEAADAGDLLPSDEVWRDDDPDFRVRGYEVDDLFPELEGEPPEGVIVEQEAAASIPVDEPDLPEMIFQSSPSDAGSVACPYCWYKCEPEDVLYIARHPELIGDSILGGDEHQRFLPSRFTPDGLAIDAGGVACPEVACPRCHMRLPTSMVSMPPLFLSLVGAPASGKSYYLTSMCWRLRRTLLKDFLIRFSDSDATVNRWLNDYEERLFVQPDETSFQSIDKTQLQGDLYREITYNDMGVSLPLPSVFALQAEESSIFHREVDNFVNRSLVLYDNAGEHFEPGRDSAQDPGTHHLIHSEAILFSFDPTKDPSFRAALRDVTDDLQVQREYTVQRQDILLTEVINRIRLYLGLDARERFSKPIIVVLSKADILADILADVLGEQMASDPWRWDEEIEAHSLDLSRILQVSFACRSLIERFSPETVSAVESFATDVVYIPASALGHSPRRDPSYEGSGDAPLVVRSCDVKPQWVEVPMLYVLFKLGYISSLRDVDEAHPHPDNYEVRGGMFHFVVPGTSKRVKLPLTYAGTSLQCPDTGTWFRVPDEE